MYINMRNYANCSHLLLDSWSILLLTIFLPPPCWKGEYMPYQSLLHGYKLDTWNQCRQFHLKRIPAYCLLPPHMGDIPGGCGCSSLGPHELDVERMVPHLAVQAVRMFHQGITHATRCTCTWLHHMCVHILKRFVEVQVWPWACMGATSEHSWLFMSSWEKLTIDFGDTHVFLY